MRQLVELTENLSKFEASKTTLVAVSADDENQTRALARRMGVGFSLISDPDNAIAKRYAADIKGAALYIVRPDGVIQYGYTDPPNWLDRPPLHMLVSLAAEAADPNAKPRTSEFDAPCRPQKGVWICEP